VQQQRLREKLLIGAMRRLGRLPLSLLHPLGSAIGTLLWWSRGRTREVTEINLARCLPELDEQARLALARQRLAEFGRNALAMLHVWFAKPERVLATIAEVEGEALLKEALAAGRGALVLAPHHGNWELAGMYLGRRYGITSMYLPNRNNPGLDQLVRDVRSRDGATLVPADGSGVRALLKALKAGRMVGVLPDQEPKQAGAEFAPFFGTPALTMTLAANLLARTGARAVMVYALRLPEGGYRLVFRAPDQALYSDDLPTALAGLNRSVEQCARDNPAQYQWEYKRFKNQPPGVPEPY
jgi:KDO2-lipid IV(A) lauroyltransferase